MNPSILAFTFSCLVISSEAAKLSEKEKPAVVTGPPSIALYNKAKEHLDEVIRLPFPTYQEYPTLPPSLIRLAFHDCVGPDGCDGCINLDNPDNHGFEEVVEFLAQDRDEYFPEISFADYLWISAIASLEKGSEKFTQLGFNFKGGRVDCPTSPLTEDIYPFPDPSMQREEMMEFFADPVNGFGFTENEVIAIIGAHGMGGAIRDQSGYEGAWTPGRDTIFNNELYQVIANNAHKFHNKPVYPDGDFELYPGDKKYQWNYTEYTQPDVGNGHTEWETFMLLNTDMQLGYDIDVDNYGFGTQCIVGNDVETEQGCRPIPSALKLIESFAEDEDLFLAAFMRAYEKMSYKTKYPLYEPR